jgi:thiol-disulfide isomerase/thioredoxin
MAAVQSNMLQLGTLAPSFTLLDTQDNIHKSFESLKSDKGTVIMFICNHCPFVKHLNSALSQFAKDYQAKGMSIIAISSNDAINYPDDSPEKMKENAIAQNFTFPYLYDESQEVAKNYKAACTPDFYLFDGDLKLVYRGQFDSSRPNNGTSPSGEDLRNACDALLNSTPINPTQLPSIGCNIKWK